MADPQTQRERTSLQQLTAVANARQLRLQTERQALAQRERALVLAWEDQQLDEALLDEQRAQWAARWQAWAQVGGALRSALSLRQDKELLTQMAALLADRRARLQAQADQLNQALGEWTQRWRGAQAFEESLAVRARALRIALERASDRLRDEEALMALAAPAMGAAQLAMQG